MVDNESLTKSSKKHGKGYAKAFTSVNLIGSGNDSSLCNFSFLCRDVGTGGKCS